jgi:hypothetical protein
MITDLETEFFTHHGEADHEAWNHALPVVELSPARGQGRHGTRGQATQGYFPEPAVGLIWDRGLLDRLHTPLTRFHE